MTVSKSPRLGLTRWSADDDPWDREDFDADNAALEALVAIAQQGTFLSRPAAGTRGRFYVVVSGAPDEGELYYDDGAKWITLRHSTADAPLTAYHAAITPTGNGARVQRHSSGMVTLYFNVITSAAVANNVAGGLATVPVGGFRPAFAASTMVNRSGTDTTPTLLKVSTAGVVSTHHSLASGTTIEGTLTYPAAGT